MPNRFLKESITTSDTLPLVSMEAEVLFYRLIVKVDDFGRYHGEPHLILAQALSNRIAQVSQDDVEHWLSELAAAGLLRRYRSNGRPYIELATFTEHNSPRAAASRFPDPPADDNDCEQVQTVACNCSQTQADANRCEQPKADASKCSQGPTDANVRAQPKANVSVFDKRIRSTESVRARAREVAADPEVTEKFTRFMQTYPKRADDGQAWEEWCVNIAVGASPDNMIKAAGHYAAMTRERKTMPRWIKNPATFLRESWHRFVDGIPENENDRSDPRGRDRPDDDGADDGESSPVPGYDATRKYLQAKMSG